MYGCIELCCAAAGHSDAGAPRHAARSVRLACPAMPRLHQTQLQDARTDVDQSPRRHDAQTVSLPPRRDHQLRRARLRDAHLAAGQTRRLCDGVCTSLRGL